MLFTPKVLKSSNPGDRSWAQIHDILYTTENMRPLPGYVAPPGMGYMFNNPYMIGSGLLDHQSKVLSYLYRADKENIITPEQLKASRSGSSTNGGLTSIEEGALYLSSRNSRKLSDQLLFLGLAWLADHARFPKPEINIDEMQLFDEKTHHNPERALIRTAHIKNPIERSRDGLFLNRWFKMKMSENKHIEFKYDVSHSPELQNGDYSNLNLHKLRASSSDLSGSLFRLSYLHYAEMEQCKISDTQFISAMLLRVKFNESLCRNSKFNWSNLQSVEAKGTDFTGSEFIQSSLSNMQAQGANFDECTIAGDRSQTRLTHTGILTGQHHINYTSAIHIHDYVSNTSFKRARLEWLNLENCNLYQCEFFETTFKDVRIEKTKLGTSQFRDCIFEGAVVFDECDFTGVSVKDLSRSKIRGSVTLKHPVGFSDTELDQLEQAGFVIEKKPQSTYKGSPW